jgi:hypothetical protein
MRRVGGGIMECPESSMGFWAIEDGLICSEDEYMSISEISGSSIITMRRNLFISRGSLPASARTIRVHRRVNESIGIWENEEETGEERTLQSFHVSGTEGS